MGATISHRITVRYSSVLAGLKPEDRAIFEGRTLQIGVPKELGRREYLEMNATEAV